MRRHRMEVDLYLDDDDQSDAVTVVEVLEHWLKKCMDHDEAENGARWPRKISVLHRGEEGVQHGVIE